MHPLDEYFNSLQLSVFMLRLHSLADQNSQKYSGMFSFIYNLRKLFHFFSS